MAGLGHRCVERVRECARQIDPRPLDFAFACAVQRSLTGAPARLTTAVLPAQAAAAARRVAQRGGDDLVAAAAQRRAQMTADKARRTKNRDTHRRVRLRAPVGGGSAWIYESAAFEKAAISAPKTRTASRSSVSSAALDRVGHVVGRIFYLQADREEPPIADRSTRPFEPVGARQHGPPVIDRCGARNRGGVAADRYDRRVEQVRDLGRIMVEQVEQRRQIERLRLSALRASVAPSIGLGQSGASPCTYRQAACLKRLPSNRASGEL